MKPKHKWKKVNSYDRFRRQCVYCPSCDALALSDEDEYIDLLNKMGCSLINKPFELFVRTHNTPLWFSPSVDSLKIGIKRASYFYNCGFDDIWFENENGIKMDIEKRLVF